MKINYTKFQLFLEFQLGIAKLPYRNLSNNQIVILSMVKFLFIWKFCIATIYNSWLECTAINLKTISQKSHFRYNSFNLTIVLYIYQ